MLLLSSAHSLAHRPHVCTHWACLCLLCLANRTGDTYSALTVVCIYNLASMTRSRRSHTSEMTVLPTLPEGDVFDDENATAERLQTERVEFR